MDLEGTTGVPQMVSGPKLLCDHTPTDIVDSRLFRRLILILVVVCWLGFLLVVDLLEVGVGDGVLALDVVAVFDGRADGRHVDGRLPGVVAANRVVEVRLVDGYRLALGRWRRRAGRGVPSRGSTATCCQLAGPRHAGRGAPEGPHRRRDRW